MVDPCFGFRVLLLFAAILVAMGASVIIAIAKRRLGAVTIGFVVAALSSVILTLVLSFVADFTPAAALLFGPILGIVLEGAAAGTVALLKPSNVSLTLEIARRGRWINIVFGVFVIAGIASLPRLYWESEWQTRAIRRIEELGGSLDGGYEGMIVVHCPDANDYTMSQLSTVPMHGLDLRGSQVTDAGIDYLRGSRRLMWLDLTHTKVSAVAVEKLHHALPSSEIKWEETNNRQP